MFEEEMEGLFHKDLINSYILGEEILFLQSLQTWVKLLRHIYYVFTYSMYISHFS